MKYKNTFKKISTAVLCSVAGLTVLCSGNASVFADEYQDSSDAGNTVLQAPLETNTSDNSESGNTAGSLTDTEQNTENVTYPDGSINKKADSDNDLSDGDTKEDNGSSDQSSLTKTDNPDIPSDIKESAESHDSSYSYNNTENNTTSSKKEVLNGWKKISGKYYFYKNNKKYTGWHKMGKAEGEKTPHWSYFGSNGALRTGWVRLGKGTSEPDGNTAKHWSYFGDNGWLRTGWQQLGKGTSNPDGNTAKHWSYFGNNGWLRTGWEQLGKGTSNPDGNTAKHWSYFGDNGWLRTFWQQLGKGTPNPDGNSKAHYSYFGSNGWLVTGNKTISGLSYVFDNKGWLLKGNTSSIIANINIDNALSQLIPNGCYRISSAKNTGFSIDVWGGVAKDDTKIWSYENNNTAAQFFQIKHLGDNIYSIKTGASIYASSLDISGGKAASGASLVQKKYTGSSTQKWKIVSAGNDSYAIKTVSGNFAVDIDGGKLSQGTIKLAKYTKSDTQKFKFTKASGFLVRNGRKYYFNENGDKPMIGLDVSAWSENVDWEKAMADGIEFAVIRASHRGGQIDKYAKRNMDECTRLGIPFGVYCYSQATNNSQADHEVDVLLSVIKGYKPSLGVFIDVEDTETYERVFGSIYSANARRKITDLTKRMVNRVQKAGYLAGVYGNDPYMNNVLYLNEMPSTRWIARYFSNTASDTNVIDLNGKGYKIWQFTDKGTVKGVPNSGNADLNTLIKKYW